jgi:hypothetical protein
MPIGSRPTSFRSEIICALDMFGGINLIGKELRGKRVRIGVKVSGFKELPAVTVICGKLWGRYMLTHWLGKF